MSYKNISLMLSCLLLVACAGTPKTNLYVLEAKSQAVPATAAPEIKRLIGIGPVSIPSLLERKQIVTRNADNSLQVSEFQQWAAPLKESIVQVLTENLAKLQPNDLVKAYPWAAYGEVNYHVIIDVSRFDTTPGQSVNLEATWSVMDDKTHALAVNGKTKIQHGLTDSSYPATVNALSQTLSDFSKEIALGLLKL